MAADLQLVPPITFVRKIEFEVSSHEMPARRLFL
jgi:hypothetical protein